MKRIMQAFMAILIFFMGLVSHMVNLIGMMTLQNGKWWLLGLLMAAVTYKVAESLSNFWQLWRTSRSKLEQIRELLLSAQCGDMIREYALIYRIRQQGQAIHVRKVLSGADLVVIDVSGLALRGNDELKGTKWTLISQNGGGQVEGEVVDYDGKQAHVRLPQPSSVTPQVGDLATPLAPGQATDVECLAARVLCVVGG